MDGGRRHIDVGEAMAHNRMVEQAREAEHQRRCDQWPAYKRVYERWLTMNRELVGEIQAVQQTICDQMRQQTVQPLSDSMKSQPVKIKGQSVPIQSKEDLECLAAEWHPWTCFFLGMMFSGDEKLKQMREDYAATQEMIEVNDKYDRQLIRLSGFEW